AVEEGGDAGLQEVVGDGLDGVVAAALEGDGPGRVDPEPVVGLAVETDGGAVREVDARRVACGEGKDGSAGGVDVESGDGFGAPGVEVDVLGLRGEAEAGVREVDDVGRGERLDEVGGDVLGREGEARAAGV